MLRRFTKILAVIHQRTAKGFIGEVKARVDVKLFVVTPGGKEELKHKLAELVIASLPRES